MCRVLHDITNSPTMVNNYQRRFVVDFPNHRAYDILATWHNVRGLYGEMDDPDNRIHYEPNHRDSILSQLNGLRFCDRYDLDDLIIDPYDAIFIQLFEFFRLYGVPHWFPGVENEDSGDESPYHVGDFPVEDLDLSNEETITEEDEDWLIEMSSMSTSN